ncbi:MAG: S46 family peptidase [Bacteroidales bacterium]|nr:S46 family peptidase [Bacteroidales bacterium]MDZ4205065.1 S46 family peptidase [Bacteroidales bacterium]
MKIKSLVFTFILFTGLLTQIRADEGMWVPMFFKDLIYSDMQKMGLKLTADELYSINNASLKDAIVGLAGGGAPNSFFCSAEIVSPQGLLLTNHHCAYDMLQKHSSVELDYLTDGFWAMNREEELPNEGITATILVRMEDMTSIVLADITPEMSDTDRSAVIRKAINKLKEENSENGKYDVAVKSFFSGNEYYMLVYETYRDVRLVGAPPSAIGKFGGDTDNWMWPRHTGDFAVLRIYTAPDGSPAGYSKDNIPLKPKHHLPISIKGVECEDFAMIWGFPGNTQRYLTSYGVQYNIEHFQPLIVNLLGKRLEIMKEHMDADAKVKIQYASSYASIANSWKYFIGQTRGLKRLNVFEQKQEIEKDFNRWVSQDETRNEKYSKVLSQMQQGYQLMQQEALNMMTLNLGAMGSASALGISAGVSGIYAVLEKDPKNHEALKEAVGVLRPKLDDYYKDYDYNTDRNLFATFMHVLHKNLDGQWHPAFFGDVMKKFKGNFEAYADWVYANSVFSNRQALEKFLEKPTLKTIKRDPLFKARQQLQELAMKAAGGFRTGQGMVSKAEKLWVNALREMQPDKVFFPDANSTIRMTFGKVLDYYPADAVHYDYKTTLAGVMEKEDPSNEEFIVPSRLKELYQMKDFGQYGTDGNLYVGFITNHDITGGNSGSGVTNGDGHLIGIAFDGNWEAMSGDIAFETELQRTINVDIRYVLFVIDKYAGATHLINEMTIVR